MLHIDMSGVLAIKVLGAKLSHLISNEAPPQTNES